MQTVKLTAKNSDFDGFAPKKRRVSSLEGGPPALDTVSGSTLPWYNDQRDVDGVPGPDGFFRSATDPAAAIVGRSFGVVDWPRLPATDTMTLTIGGVTDGVDRFSILDDFELCFCVHTTEATNDSETIYTKRARASWRFDGSGNIDQNGDWSQTGTGNTGDNTLTEITTGERATSTGPTANDLLANETWSTKNQ